MSDSFEERRRKQALSQREGFKIWTLEELLNTEFPPTAEERLQRLCSNWNPSLFSDAAAQLAESHGLTVAVFRSPLGLPKLDPETVFKYQGEYESCGPRYNRGERLVVVTVSEDTRVIGYGIAVMHVDRVEIEIIDVDLASRRSAGVELRIEVTGETFGVGVGHVIARRLIEELGGAVLEVDATNDESRFIFKSMGFVPQPGSNNPCILMRPARNGV